MYIFASAEAAHFLNIISDLHSNTVFINECDKRTNTKEQLETNRANLNKVITPRCKLADLAPETLRICFRSCS